MIWLIGAGDMAVSYLKVLEAQEKAVTIVGRGADSARLFEEKTGHAVAVGGITNFLNEVHIIPQAAIICVGVEQLYSSCKQLLEYGVKRLLIEKPGVLSLSEIKDLELCSFQHQAEVFIAYNRRFYSSVIKAQELIEADGGVTSFNFELTEWAHVIEGLNKRSDVLAKWFIANSTHVADLAFFLGGKPEQISCFTSGSLSWHPSSSVFAGAGVATSGALFNYGANWESAGRWSVEVLTKLNRYILRPMESLLIQKRGTINHIPVEVDNQIDKDFKPGLFLQVEAFLSNDTKDLCSLSEQVSLFSTYEKMANYQ